MQIRNASRGLVQRYGPRKAKRLLWDKEFAVGRWDVLDQTEDDRTRVLVERFANGGHILDLGCGTGTTSITLDPAVYTRYTGVDISDVAIKVARARAQKSGHAGLNEYCESDILMYKPSCQFDVILFGDSIYYVPSRRIAPLLSRYSTFLTARGVFVARLFDVSGKHQHILDTIESHFETVEKHIHKQTQAVAIVFRPLPENR